MKFRKKPVVIEAWPVAELRSVSDFTQLPPAIHEAWVEDRLRFYHDGIAIRTLEGEMIAQPKDWVIRGVAGELYPCKPEIFETTYEQAEE